MKVILIAAISADGQIAEATDQSSLDWTSKEDLRFFVKKTKECGVVVMGRKTFETIGKSLKDRKLIIMTRSASDKEQMDGVEYVSKSPKEIIDRLRSEGQGQVAIAGGSSIYGQFLKAGLVTDIYLTVEPVLFGTGIPFAKDIDRINMKLESVEKLGEQSVLMHYTV